MTGKNSKDGVYSTQTGSKLLTANTPKVLLGIISIRTSNC